MNFHCNTIPGFILIGSTVMLLSFVGIALLRAYQRRYNDRWYVKIDDDNWCERSQNVYRKPKVCNKVEPNPTKIEFIHLFFSIKKINTDGVGIIIKLLWYFLYIFTNVFKINYVPEMK